MAPRGSTLIRSQHALISRPMGMSSVILKKSSLPQLEATLSRSVCSSSGSELPGVAAVGTFLPAAASSAHGSATAGRTCSWSVRGSVISVNAMGAPSSLEPPLSGPSVASESVSSLAARGRESARPAAARAARRAAGPEAASAVIRTMLDRPAAGAMVAGSVLLGAPPAVKSSGRGIAGVTSCGLLPGLRGASCAVSLARLASDLITSGGSSLPSAPADGMPRPSCCRLRSRRPVLSTSAAPAEVEAVTPVGGLPPSAHGRAAAATDADVAAATVAATAVAATIDAVAVAVGAAAAAAARWRARAGASVSSDPAAAASTMASSAMLRECAGGWAAASRTVATLIASRAAW
eukprot:scaffold82838_cov56-Phaeocystis_antarctica.AAC.4